MTPRRPIPAPLVLVEPLRRLTRRLADASPPVAAVFIGVSLATYATLVAGIALWDNLNIAGVSRSWAEVWRAWHEKGTFDWFGPAERAALLIAVGGAALVLFMGWLNLSFAYAHGSVAPAYWRCVRGGSALLVPLIVLTLLLGVVAVPLADTLNDLALPIFYSQFIWFGGVAIVGVTLLLAHRSVVAELAPVVPLPVLPPRCEGCGYDLTHQPADGRCPECGKSVAESLDVNARRPAGVSDGSDLQLPLEVAASVLFRPRIHYARLRVRDGNECALWFAGWQIAGIFCGAVLWAILMFLLLAARHGPPTPMRGTDVLAGVTMASIGISFGTTCCWFLWRVVAAIVASVWLASQVLPDFRWAVKVICYESVFLWIFCVYWGAALGSMVLLDDWVARLTGLKHGFFGLPAELLLIATGSAALLGVWFWRYALALRYIRWNNA